MQCHTSITDWALDSPQLNVRCFLKSTPIYYSVVFFTAEAGTFKSITVGFWKASGCAMPGSWQSRDVPLLLPQWQADARETDSA